MSHSHVAGRLTAAGLLVTALVAAVPTASAAAPHDAEGSAYGLTVAGPLDVPPVPAVSSRSGDVSKHLVREDLTDLVDASALDVSAAADRARSTVARVAVPSAKLRAEAVTAECKGGEGHVSLARASLAGRSLDVSPPPNTTVPVDVPVVGRGSLTLNKQQRRADGRLDVTAVELRLPIPGDAATIRIASATCGRAAAPPKAPAPTPVKRDLPVTG
ncbi:hypothetical protein BZB76_1200 [Actinomadura pelletieri DSM 43383]|uniref:Secreted protein n=1 Tax=Actinomadura pelletieri DSM 43383 TaxID=1120940 RepID=A0A495R0B5_9ACTN|nr:choice-of-anchor P family protein [Actinomadura pelletieri]RKS79722.1 hypothetical protein BZB76_1200 [Actinomadura pelletieri DSM 43383]